MKELNELRVWLNAYLTENKISQNAFARAIGVQQGSLSRFLNEGAGLNFESALKILDRLGFAISPPEDAPEETTREVCFIDAKIVPAGDNMPPPKSEHYVAVPMVDEVGAGPGIIPQGELRSWVLLYKDHPSVMRRSNLLAVEVGRNQMSMTPTLHPGDIVLVDRDDWGKDGYNPPGNIFLVREPGQDGGGMVKRVSIDGRNEETTVTFYSDNKEYRPSTYLLNRYDGDIRAAIVGRVVWAWSDLSRK